ncbi:hypothetical protein GCM10027048_33540 [Hymenobacter coalescens]
MLHALPITNVRLLACPEDWAGMTPTAQGRHCAACNREAIDFTQASAAELAVVRDATPDGRVCGRLLGGRPLRLGLWARGFVVGLMLVFGQGLTAREAVAQAKKTAKPASGTARRPGAATPRRAVEAIDHSPQVGTGLITVTVASHSMPPAPIDTVQIYTYVEQMPLPPGGMEALVAVLRRPLVAGGPAGRVFVGFVVEPDGRLTQVRLIKGLTAAADTEALRLVQQLPRPWAPGRQNGVRVRVQYTVLVTFGADKP